MSEAALLREQAIAAERMGDIVEARRLVQGAIAAAPDDAALLNSAGTAYLRWNDPARAAQLFANARRIAPDTLDYAINEAIALGRLERHEAARNILVDVEPAGSAPARYWSARAHAERACDALAQAQASYDRALECEANHPRALHGRARVALERNQADAVERFDRALGVAPHEPELWLGKASALDAAGRSGEARALVAQLVERAPQWIDALVLLARLRLAEGDPDFADHFESAVARSPADDSVFTAWIKTLGSMDAHEAAADIAARARTEAQGTRSFALEEAVYAGLAGQLERAEAILSDDAAANADWREEQARHDIRMGRIERAEAILGELLSGGETVARWALRDVCWRLLHDERHHWLHGQEGVVAAMDLPESGAIADAKRLLEHLHRTAALPLGQSVRGGTQTRGALFQREDIQLKALRTVVEHALERYRGGLPERDSDHPLLRERDAPWRIAHSWSVRLSGAGYHISHIHPEGLLSSALYLVVPSSNEEGEEGYLEIGRPPPDLLTDLAPLSTVRPAPGRLALFPSTLYHGTRPFNAGTRMTAVFDVTTGNIV